MGLKLGALAAGVGMGYMAADKWKRKKDEPSEKGAKVYRGYGPGYGVEESEGPGDAATNYADGGMVCDKRWMKKTAR